ncbi:hypothetical protein D3C80_2178330 [compost metagenome]
MNNGKRPRRRPRLRRKLVPLALLNNKLSKWNNADNRFVRSVLDVPKSCKLVRTLV